MFVESVEYDYFFCGFADDVALIVEELEDFLGEFDAGF